MLKIMRLILGHITSLAHAQHVHVPAPVEYSLELYSQAKPHSIVKRHKRCAKP